MCYRQILVLSQFEIGPVESARYPDYDEQIGGSMVGPGGLAGHEYYTRKNLRKNWRFLLIAAVIVCTFLYFWMK